MSESTASRSHAAWWWLSVIALLPILYVLSVPAVLWCANVKVHPVQLFDWLGGIFFFDPMVDNVGTTRTIGKLDADEKEAIARLLK